MIIGLLGGRELGILARQVLLWVDLLVLGELLLLLLPLHVPVLWVGRVGWVDVGVVLLGTQHLLVLALLCILLLAQVRRRHLRIRRKLLVGVGVLLGHVEAICGCRGDLMVLHLLNYLLHILASVLQLRKLLSEALIEGF